MDFPYLTLMVSRVHKPNHFLRLALSVFVVIFFVLVSVNAVLDYGEYKYCQGLHDMAKLKVVKP